MRILILALLVACGGGKSKAVTDPEMNRVAPAPPAKPASKTKFSVEMRARPSAGRAVEGVITDVKAKAPLVGVTITVTSPVLQGAQTAITDEVGKFFLESLPPGEYELTAYYGDATTMQHFKVEADKLAALTLDWDIPPAGEVVQIVADEPKFTSMTEALARGAMGQAVHLGREELAKKPSARGHAMLALARYGFAIEILRMDGFAFAGRNKTAADTKQAMVEFLAALDEVQTHVAGAAKDPKFSLELCIACMAADDGMFFVFGGGAFDVEYDRNGKELPEGDKRRRPTYRFDHGDLAWARAMVHYQQAIANITLAYDWGWIDRIASDDAKPEKKITIKLVEPARIAKAKEHILAGLVASDDARVAYLAETDDDREWVPSPKQKNYAAPLVVDAALYKSWENIVADVRTLVGGGSGIDLKAVWSLFEAKGAPAGFIDVAALLNEPKDIVFEVGSIDRMEVERTPAKRAKQMTSFMQNLLGNGYKKQMKASPLTERLLQLRKDRAADEKRFEEKMKYLLWLN